MSELDEEDIIGAFSMIVEEYPPEQNNHDCKGLIFRGYTNEYYDSRTHKIEMKQGLRLLKRKSCICENTLWMLDYLNEEVSDVDIPKNIQYGKLYKLKVIHYSAGTYEYPDECSVELGFIEYKE